MSHTWGRKRKRAVSAWAHCFCCGARYKQVTTGRAGSHPEAASAYCPPCRKGTCNYCRPRVPRPATARMTDDDAYDADRETRDRMGRE